MQKIIPILGWLLESLHSKYQPIPTKKSDGIFKFFSTMPFIRQFLFGTSKYLQILWIWTKKTPNAKSSSSGQPLIHFGTPMRKPRTTGNFKTAIKIP